MTKKRCFLLLTLVLFGWTQTNLAIEPSEEQIQEIVDNLGHARCWLLPVAESALRGLCLNYGTNKITEISSAPNTDFYKCHLIFLLNFFNRKELRWNCPSHQNVDTTFVFDENQQILIKAFCRTLGLKLLDGLVNEQIPKELDRFMKENFQIQSNPINQKETINNINWFLLKKINHLIEIIKILIPVQNEADKKIRKLWYSIARFGKGIHSISGDLALREIELFFTVQPKLGKRSRSSS